MTYWKSLGAWTLVLTGVVVAYPGVRALLLGDQVLLALAAWSVVRVAGAMVPFTAFGAGAKDAANAPGRLVGHLLLTAALAYVAIAWVDPVLQHDLLARRSAANGDSALEEILAQGPATPVQLLHQKDEVLTDPPERFSFRVEEPGARPPNWIDFRLHSPVAFGLFALLNGLLGAALARRRPRGDDAMHRLWLLGLVSGVGFMAPMMVAEAAVRALPAASGALAAWAPVAVPLAALAMVGGFGRPGPRSGAAEDRATRGGRG